MKSHNRFTEFCIKGLEQAYLPSERVFATRQLSGGKMLHVRDHAKEYLFTMNALMGLHHAQANGSDVFLDIESDYHATANRLSEFSSSNLHIAATVWTGRSIGIGVSTQATGLFNELLKNAPKMPNLGPKALGWSIVACLCGRDHDNALALGRLAAASFVHPKTALVRQTPAGTRKNWAPFGAHSFMAYALLRLARETEADWAREAGLRIARKLVQLQGPDGQWSWMHHVPSGRIVDYYPVFSVHQYGYAPFFLVEAIDQGFEEFRQPLLKGFNWILGQNELKETMVSPEHRVVWRRLIRKGPNTKLAKVLRGALAAYLGVKARIQGPDSVEIDRQCHGFEMALPLCIFSGRTDFGEVLDNPIFS